MSESLDSVKTLAEFEALIKDKPKVAVDFTATWCGPCKMIGPKFQALSRLAEYSGIKFVKVDVDENSETAAKYEVSAMPTFRFFKDGKEVKEAALVGASEEKLKASLNLLSKA